jgi:carboxypeptidase Q
MGWQQINTWVRMTELDTAVFAAQTTLWSPSSNGPVTAQAVSVVVHDENCLNNRPGRSPVFTQRPYLLRQTRVR